MRVGRAAVQLASVASGGSIFCHDDSNNDTTNDDDRRARTPYRLRRTGDKS
jgi:hypothetical protein